MTLSYFFLFSRLSDVPLKADDLKMIQPVEAMIKESKLLPNNKLDVEFLKVDELYKKTLERFRKINDKLLS